MNLRAQQLLHTLGVTRWAGRQVLLQQHAPAPLWGREPLAEPAPAPVAPLVPAAMVPAVSQQPVTEPFPVPSVRRPQPVPTVPEPVSPPEPAPEPVAAAPRKPAEKTEPTASVSTLRFGLQAWVLNAGWIVLADEPTLQDPQAQQLWQQIGLAFGQKTPRQFYWPMALGERWQQDQGAAAALEGFLFGLGPTQRVGLLGQLPDQVCGDRLERLPSLNELLAEPLRKRTLLQLLAPDWA